MFKLFDLLFVGSAMSLITLLLTSLYTPVPVLENDYIEAVSACSASDGLVALYKDVSRNYKVVCKNGAVITYDGKE